MCTGRMRNILLYILILCAHSFAKNEEKLHRGNLKLTNKDLEEEARKDIENLLKDAHQYSDKDDEETQVNTFNELQSINKRNLMQKVDQLLNKVSGKRKANQNETSIAKGNIRWFHAKDLTPTPRDIMKNLGFEHMKNLETIKSRVTTVDRPLQFDKNNRYEQLMQKFLLSHKDSANNKDSRGKPKLRDSNINFRKRVYYVDLKPEVYPVLNTTTSDHKHGDNNISGNDKHDLLDADELESNNKDKTNLSAPVKRTGNMWVTKNYDHLHRVLENLLRQRSKSHTTRTQLSLVDNLLNSVNKDRSRNIGRKGVSKNSNNRKIKVLRNSDIENVARLGDLVEMKHQHENRANSGKLDLLRSIDKGKLQDFMQRMDIEHRYDDEDTYSEEYDSNDNDRTLRSPRNKVDYNNKPTPTGSATARQGHRGSRNRRSTFTQAGYTQDPDTCKTYNENLIKLWANLSKFINNTEQPKKRALHNIAMMIQAYLEHQNTKLQQYPIDPYKVKPEGSRDKVSEVIIRIKKTLEEGEGSPERITKTILKYIKPLYGDVENVECQQVNEEFINSSVELLYKNYLENADCRDDGDGIIVRNKKLNLRKYSDKVISQPISMNWHSSNSGLKPEFNSILIEDELYKDFHKGKIPRQRPTTINRKVFKRSRKQNSPASIYRSGDRNINENDKEKTRLKLSRSKRQKKHSLKTSLGKCERYAIRKLSVSLRPVIERFMGLLECQLDNTLRSLNNYRVSMSPFLLYASKFYHNEDSRRHEQRLPNTKLSRKHTQRTRNMSSRKSQPNNRYVDSDENNYDDDDDDDYNIVLRNDENNSPWIRKYRLDKTTDMNYALPVVTEATNFQGSDPNKENNNNNHLTSYKEYFRSPPLYDNYDSIYKSHEQNAFPSFINPLMSANDIKNTVDKMTIKIAAEPLQEQVKDTERNNAFYEEKLLEEPSNLFNISDHNMDLSNKTDSTGATDLTVRDNDELIEDAHPLSEDTIKSFTSITEFLKRARDASLQTPEFAVPFALNSNKGYVELTHLIKYPKILIYRPQFIVKNTMPYDDFLKTINNFNMTNDEVRLMKIVRHLPDSTVKVLFETEDFESPLEVRNIKDFRRSGLKMLADNYPFGRTIDTKNRNKNGNTDFVDEAYGERSVYDYRGGVNSNDVDAIVTFDGSDSDEHSTTTAIMESNLDSNLTVNSPSESSSISGLASLTSELPSLASGLPIFATELPSLASNLPSLALNLTSIASHLMSKYPSLSSGMSAEDSAVSSAEESKIGSGIGTVLDLDSSIKLNPMNPSQLSSYLSKVLPLHSISETTSNPHSSLNSQSQINVQSHVILPPNSHSGPAFDSPPHSHLPSLDTNLGPNVSKTANSVPAFESIRPSTPLTLSRWWKKWKNIMKGKLKKIVGRMATLADNIDHKVKP